MSYCRTGLLWLLIGMAPVAGAYEITVGGTLNYADTNNPLTVDGKSASFKVGGAGLVASFKSVDLGRADIEAGIGYSPSEDVAFLSLAANGDASSYYYRMAYQFPIRVANKWVLEPYINYTHHTISGDFEGQFGSQSLTVDTSSDVSFLAYGVNLHYLLGSSNFVYVGLGELKSDIHADVNGRLSSGISAATNVMTTDTTFNYTVGYVFEVFGRESWLEFSSAKIRGDQTVNLRSLRLYHSFFSF